MSQSNGDNGWATVAKIATGFVLGAIVSNKTVRDSVATGCRKVYSAIQTKVTKVKEAYEAKKSGSSQPETTEAPTSDSAG